MDANRPSRRKDSTAPFWLRTKQRLDHMATWSAQRTPTSLGFDELIALREEQIALKSRELILLIKKREEGIPEPWVEGDGSNKIV